MELQKNSEFVRLVHNEPLTLVCSALADFLWEDFVRDTRPNVTYLIDTYNIKQLSRFGKEVFERLYNADEVKWLVTEDAFEEYFPEDVRRRLFSNTEGLQTRECDLVFDHE
jgi:hypothetical protein